MEKQTASDNPQMQHVPPVPRFKLKHVPLFGVLSIFLLLTIAVVVYFTGKSQEIRKKAAVSADVNMALAPGTITVAPNATFPLQLVVSSGSHPVTTIQLSLTYDPKAIEITGHTLPAGWIEIIPKIDNVNGKMTITLFNVSAPTGNFVALNLTVHAKPTATGTTAITFTAGENIVLISTDQTIGSGNNHVGSTTGSQITIQGPIPTKTPTPVQTRTPTPIRTSTPVQTRTPTPIRTSTPTPTRTPTPIRTNTPTPIRTSTPTATRTPTPIRTPTPTPIRGPTSIPTQTPTPILTNTSTPTPRPTPTLKPGDLTGDGTVDIYDYNIMLEDFGKTGSPGWIPADINKDGTVDIYDYNILIGNFGT